MASLYAKENFPLEVVRALRALGHDVLTAQEARNAGHAIPDVEVLAFAAGSVRAVLTLNRRDFIKLHQVQPDHAGIIVCTPDPDPGQQAERIHQVLESAGSLGGQLLRVNRPPR